MMLQENFEERNVLGLYAYMVMFWSKSANPKDRRFFCRGLRGSNNEDTYLVKKLWAYTRKLFNWLSVSHLIEFSSGVYKMDSVPI